MTVDELMQMPSLRRGMLSDQSALNRDALLAEQGGGSYWRDREGEQRDRDQFMMDILGTATPFGAITKVDKLAKAIANLPMGKASRMKRADDMGYTIDAYHGTGDNIKEFDLTHPNRKDSGWLGKGIYTTDSPRLAGDYSILKAGDAGPNIMPLSVSLKNPYFATLKDKQRLQAIEHNDGSFWGSVEADNWTQKLKALGHDGVILPYKAADVGASNVSREIVAFEPHQIRSKFAKFDPTKSKSGDILASVGGTALAAPILSERE